MDFQYFGGGCVLITTKKLQILIDPPKPEYKLKLPKLKPDVILKTEVGSEGFKHNGEFLIESPGEYEIKGVMIQGIPARLHIDKKEDRRRAIMYSITTGDLHTLVTGNISPGLNEAQLEAIGEIDILTIPVGGKGLTLDANSAAKLVSQLEPRYVIPIHYAEDKANYPVPQDSIGNFLKEIGSETTNPQAKFKITNKDLAEDTQIIVLKPGP